MSPVWLTLATRELDDDHAVVLPVRTTLVALSATAVAVVLPPMASDALPSVTFTAATGGGLTVMSAVPLALPALAVTIADPADTPVTNPLEFTVAMVDALLVQDATGAVVQFVELIAATMDCVPPGMTLAVAGETLTLVTTHGGGGDVPSPPHATAATMRMHLTAADFVRWGAVRPTSVLMGSCRRGKRRETRGLRARTIIARRRTLP